MLFAVRITIAKREPVLLVGIVASIKENVVLSVPTRSARGRRSPTRCRRSACRACSYCCWGVTAFLLRLKKREPGEGDDDARTRPIGPAHLDAEGGGCRCPGPVSRAVDSGPPAATRRTLGCVVERANMGVESPDCRGEFE